MTPFASRGEGGEGPGGPGGAHEDDERLLGELRAAAARFDPPPSDLPGTLKALLSWRDPDAELAALVADSRELAGAVRGATEEILLRFEAPPFAITVEARPGPTGDFSLTGHVEPRMNGNIEVLHGEPGREEHWLLVQCDEWGRFEARPVGLGPISLRLTPAEGRPVRTPWVVL